MSIHLHKSHNVSLMMYHIVCPAKYRRIVLTEAVDKTLKETCREIAKRYEMHFLEVGTDADHMHFLVQSVPMMLPQSIVQTIKSITAREAFKRNPEVKKQLWGGQFWKQGVLHQHSRSEPLRKCRARLRAISRQGKGIH